jgi:hypothetical protein
VRTGYRDDLPTSSEQLTLERAIMIPMEQGTMRLGFSQGPTDGRRASRSKWATLKLKRSWWLFNELINRVDIWNATSGINAPIRVSDSRTAIQFLTPAGLIVPTDEWALLLGDALHNARSALDAVIWDLAHFGGAIPRAPHLVGFPITRTEGGWAEALKNLESVPGGFLDRIRSVQPWVEPPQSEDAVHWLLLLARLDNDHKHRGAVTAVPTGESLTLEGLDVRLGQPTEEGGYLRFLHDVVGAPPSAGEPFAEFSFGAVIDSGPSVDAFGHFDLHAAVRYDRHVIPMTFLQSTLVPHLETVIGMIESGTWPQESWVTPTASDVEPPDSVDTPR